MNNARGHDEEDFVVDGFEVPSSPDSSYNNVYAGNEDVTREPPAIPPQLHVTLLNCPSSGEASISLPVPHQVVLNHLCLENREASRSVVGLGLTHRFRSKYVTVVLYKPVTRPRGSTTS